LVGRFQFHLPPVFRPSRSASLSLPPREGHEENGAAMKQPHLEAPHEPLNLLVDWISREQLAGELGITSDTLARVGGAPPTGPALHTHREKVALPPDRRSRLDPGAGTGASGAQITGAVMTLPPPPPRPMARRSLGRGPGRHCRCRPSQRPSDPARLQRSGHAWRNRHRAQGRPRAAGGDRRAATDPAGPT